MVTLCYGALEIVGLLLLLLFVRKYDVLIYDSYDTIRYGILTYAQKLADASLS